MIHSINPTVIGVMFTHLAEMLLVTNRGAENPGLEDRINHANDAVPQLGGEDLEGMA